MNSLVENSQLTIHVSLICSIFEYILILILVTSVLVCHHSQECHLHSFKNFKNIVLFGIENVSLPLF